MRKNIIVDTATIEMKTPFSYFERELCVIIEKMGKTNFLAKVTFGEEKTEMLSITEDGIERKVNSFINSCLSNEEWFRIHWDFERGFEPCMTMSYSISELREYREKYSFVIW